MEGGCCCAGKAGADYEEVLFLFGLGGWGWGYALVGEETDHLEVFIWDWICSGMVMVGLVDGVGLVLISVVEAESDVSWGKDPG